MDEPSRQQRLVVILIALYAVSLAAAAFLALRPSSSNTRDGHDNLEHGQSLLSLTQKDSVGWIPIHGAIYNSEGGKPWERGAEQWAKRIRAMSETKGIKAIVLDINSPGGSVGAVQELYSQILRVRREKKIPVIALFDDVAASGGYYIAAACDKIVAHPGTLTGSIGVIFEVSNMEGLFNKIGLKLNPIKSGKHKDIGSPARTMTAEERAMMQALIDDAYSQFVAAVAEGRHLTISQVKPLADGRIFSGHQALASGLVDQLGDSTDAVELAAKLAGLAPHPKVRRDADPFNEIWSLFESKFGGSLLSASGLVEGLHPLTFSGLEYRWPSF